MGKFGRLALRAGGVASAALAMALAAPAAAADCDDLASLKLTDGKVTSATLVEAGKFSLPQAAGGPAPGVQASGFANLPAFCRVQATMTPTPDSDIKVEVWLPASGWNGKFVTIGNGVWAGSISYFQMGGPLGRGYAVAATDTGHTGSGISADWAVGHPEKLVDFGYRAVHEAVVTGKAAVNALYGSGPKLSYWDSCSTGGRQGLMEAYRFPADFDAISAMAPANPMTELMTQSMWVGYQPNRMPGAKLSPAKLATVHSAVLKQCDKLDGLEDGIISRPTACTFEPATLQCTGADSDSCLTPVQVDTMRAIYDGIRDANGNVVLGGFTYGSEMQLAALTQGPAPFPVALTYYSMLVFGDNKGWDWKTFDYARDRQAGITYGRDILDVPPDGLDAFFARGGKLLLSHGWNDGLIPAKNSLLFYSMLYRNIPLQQAQDQLRYFIVPGMDHCSGGEGASQFDTLGTIDDWATTGAAPNRIEATRPTVVAGFPGAPPSPPRDPLSRPLCAYPLYAKYDGEGDTSLASSFTCVAPES
ncbi:tannase/feruloyl esterase family alpha/beta hydrolase [Altererythrobacter salegens]|uniref:Tannase/feruloyl esterase family alpha/beta hydrolase n=1 Tax=Croceibacterium salegens TaxID=1737568 RepID=A0A6I4SZH6_9SPHN|nr:tannase/feruloyl esterase family alpha/beta hydrolase [Croceibacterium salegens]MXO60196.1 tannase/feruloyl esterase family alpha/beta hydrolase [Croceibacterium salegens]